MVVYIDVLFIINLIINYFILLAVSCLLKREDSRVRLLLGAALGAFYSCLLFFPQLQFLFTAALKLVLSATIVAVSYKIRSLRTFLKLIIYFYIVSFLFGGIIFAVQQFFAPPLLYVKNGIAYFDISPIYLIIASAVCYIIVALFSRMLHKNAIKQKIYKAELLLDDKSVRFDALMDTGNDLKDSVSGTPVMVAEYKTAEKLIPQEIQSVFKNGELNNVDVVEYTDFKNRFRVVPFSSVGSIGGLLPAFKPDKLIIFSGNCETTDVIVAVTQKKLSKDGTFTALLNPLMMRQKIITTDESNKKDNITSTNL